MELLASNVPAEFGNLYGGVDDAMAFWDRLLAEGYIPDVITGVPVILC